MTFDRGWHTWLRWRQQCCCVLLALVAVGAQANAGPLLRPAPGPPSAEQRLQLEADPYVMRWRMARMDSDALLRAGPSSAPLVLDLFGDVPLRAQVRSAKTLESGSSFLFGTVEGGGHFTLLRTSGGIVRGEFDSAQGFYKLRSDGRVPNRVLVKQHDRSRFPGCGFDSEAGARTVASHNQSCRLPCATQPPQPLEHTAVRRPKRREDRKPADDGALPNNRRYRVELLNRAVHIAVPEDFCRVPDSTSPGGGEPAISNKLTNESSTVGTLAGTATGET